MNEPWTEPAGPATAPDSCSAAISSGAKPAAASTSSVCSPSPGPGARAGSAGRPAQLDRRPEQLDRPFGAGLRDLDDHLSRRDQLGVERLVELEHRLQAAIVLGGELAPLLARAAREDLGHRGVAGDPGGSKAWFTRSSRSTPRQKACQNFGSSAPSVTYPSAQR